MISLHQKPQLPGAVITAPYAQRYNLLRQRMELSTPLSGTGKSFEVSPFSFTFLRQTDIIKGEKIFWEPKLC